VAVDEEVRVVRETMRVAVGRPSCCTSVLYVSLPGHGLISMPRSTRKDRPVDLLPGLDADWVPGRVTRGV
jgi:hypothetical protein